MSAAPPASFCWFDYETFGISPAWDRAAQFASIRTDAELNPIGEPVMFYCRQSDDYLPHPGACRVTGLTPQEANAKGLPEHRFIDRVRDELGAPGTCSVGFNSVRFDDEFTRHTLFRNLRDPYTQEWKHGASRWDLLDVVRLTRALRPDGITWPVRDDGKPSNRLEHLAAANDLEQGRAHDALVDVRVTIAVARMIRERQPRLFAHALAHRDKRSIASLLDLAARRPVVLINAFIPAARHHLAVVLPLFRHPDNPNAVIVFDLAHDPGSLVGADAGNITKGSGLHVVALNKCPAVAPIGVLRDSDAERLGIDRAQIARNERAAFCLLEASTIRELETAFAQRSSDLSTDDESLDVDGSLYSGSFLSSGDRDRLDALIAADPFPRDADTRAFDDPRLPELVFRYRARNFPDTLDSDDAARWRAHVQTRLFGNPPGSSLGFESFRESMQTQDWTDAETSLRDALDEYAQALEARYKV